MFHWANPKNILNCSSSLRWDSLDSIKLWSYRINTETKSTAGYPSAPRTTSHTNPQSNNQQHGNCLHQVRGSKSDKLNWILITQLAGLTSNIKLVIDLMSVLDFYNHLVVLVTKQSHEFDHILCFTFNVAAQARVAYPCVTSLVWGYARSQHQRMKR